MVGRRTRHTGKIARAFTVSALAAIAIAGGCATSSAESSNRAEVEPAAFNGHDLAGWVRRGGQAEYRVDDGAIVGSTLPDQPNTFLCTAREYSDFVLELEFLVDSELNSGIQIRSHARAEDTRERVFGYQVEIDPSERAWTGGIYDEGRRGWLQTPHAAARRAFKAGEWNQMRIEAIGPRIMTWLNGVPAADITDGMDSSGFIALQVHDVGKRESPLRVRWRTIRLTDLAQEHGSVP